MTSQLMKAVICKAYGPPDTLEIDDIPKPVAAPGEILVRIQACGINFPDILMIENKYQERQALPFIPGGEVAGTIEALGDGVSGFSIGQEVIALIFTGGLAEYVCARVDQIRPKPDNLSMAQAAAFSGVYGTSYHALRQRAQLQQGETLLVLGASGGVGSAAVQLGKAMGARVIAAASTSEKLKFVKNNGADEVIDYSCEDLRKRVLDLTDGKGADIIYDPVGGDVFDAAIRCIAWNGRILVVGFASGRIPVFPTNRALLKGCALVGVYYGRFCKEQPELTAQNDKDVMAMLAQGQLTPRVHKSYRADESAVALQALETRTVIGKNVVLLDGFSR